MLENARRQLMLVLLAAAAAIVALATLPLNLGLDLSGGVQLIYEVDPDKAVLDGLIPADASEDDISRIMDETVAIIAERIDPRGTTEALVTRRGPFGVLIELPRMTEAETRAVHARIENLGRLEFRIVAQDTYQKGGVRFSMSEERARLSTWLNLDEGANRAVVAEKPETIRVYNSLDTDQGGALNDHLRWYPKILGPSVDEETQWKRPMSYGQAGPDDANVYHAVPAFGAEEWNGGLVKEGTPFLVEFVPINMHEDFFTGEDLDPGAIRPGLDDTGRPAILYKMRTERQDAYADWSEEYINEYSAIMLNHVVHSAPRFVSRILGGAQITGDFTNREVDALVKTLRTGSLKVKPVQQSSVVIGATLGARSIRLAFTSMGVGALLVLGFILAYYRLAGLVAFAALALNILLILGVVVMLRSTLTLPGLGGLVLTMGMAIDANILIYERIREELARGKEMLQACRTGFDRAIVTILDANLTTFIAGVVLYNVGIGPIRGFAVTLMIGIMTTLFTAFFVSRLVFHFLIETDRLRSFRVASWFKDAKYDFLSWSKRALVLSAVVLVASLVTFLNTSPDTKYAIDFTGGANLKVSLAGPMNAAEMRDLLASDEAFREAFPKPIVNTVGELTDGKSTEFAVRLKLTDQLRVQIDEERAAAAAASEDYEPPYLTGLRRILAGHLVADAYSKSQVFDNVGGQSNTSFAEIELHFTDAASSDSLREALKGLSKEVSVTPQDGDESAASGKNFLVEFDVPRDTPSDLLFAMVQSELDGKTNADGSEFRLSSPIPESSEIGGRMVGELRNSAVSALFIALFCIVMYIRVRFHEYKYGIAAVVAVLHDIFVTLGVVVLFNSFGIVDCEIDLAMIAAFLTIIGYSINDTIVIFDRVRENLSEQARLGEKIDHKALLNRSINQTLSRTILTTATTMAVLLTQFVVNFHAGTALEGFSFALVVGLISGTYSTIFIASPVVLWLWRHEGTAPTAPATITADTGPAGQPASSGA